MQGIEIPIGAPLGQLDKDLNQAQNKLKQFANEASKTSAVLGGSVAKGANQAGFALTNLGRVAQDAPFGFIGIQNNLNPLLESFQRLKAESGSTGGALKALGQSLIGPAGLGFALSIVSAAILIYQQYQQRANKETEKAKKTNEDYASTLEAVNRIQLVGAQNAAKETAELKALFGAYQNANLPLSQRKDAYAELQKQYPAYFGNLKFEEQASEKVKSAYDKLSQSIIATGRARAGIDLITKNEQKKLENEQKLVDLQTEGNNLSIKKESLLKTSAELQRTSTREGAGVSQLVQANSVQGDINENLKIQKQLKNDNKKIDQDNLRITQSINAEFLKGAKLTGDIGGKSVKVKSEKPKEDEAAKEAKKRAEQLAKEANAFGVKMLKSLQDFQIDASNEAAKRKSLLNVIDEDELNLAVREAEKAAKEIVDKFAPISVPLLTPFQKLNLYIKETIIPQLSSSFKTFFDDLLMNGKLSFDALGQAIKNTFLSVLSSEATKGVLSLLTGGDKKEGGKGGGLLGAIAGLLKIGGKKAATNAVTTGGTSAVLGSSTVASGGALLPILAGVAAVAGIASLFKKKPKQAPLPQASSTISTSAAGSAQDFGGGRVVFEISGTNLVGVLNRAGAKLQRFG
jgi:hypothetical protein